MRFAIVEHGRAVRYVMPWWRVAWAFAFWFHPRAPLIRRVFYVWACGYPVVETPDDQEDRCDGSR